MPRKRRGGNVVLNQGNPPVPATHPGNLAPQPQLAIIPSQHHPLMNQAIDASAGFGRIMAVFNVIVATLVLGGFLILGLFLTFKKDKYSATANGTISEATCSTVQSDRGAKSASCDVKVVFTAADGKKYEVQTIVSRHLAKNQSVSVSYDPTNPLDISLSPVKLRTVGIIMAVVSIIVLLLAWGWFYIVMKNKTAAAVSGVANVAGIIDGAIDG